MASTTKKGVKKSEPKRRRDVAKKSQRAIAEGLSPAGHCAQDSAAESVAPNPKHETCPELCRRIQNSKQIQMNKKEKTRNPNIEILNNFK
jgi:hypothetical protein